MRSRNFRRQITRQFACLVGLLGVFAVAGCASSVGAESRTVAGGNPSASRSARPELRRLPWFPIRPGTPNGSLAGEAMVAGEPQPSAPSPSPPAQAVGSAAVSRPVLTEPFQPSGPALASPSQPFRSAIRLAGEEIAPQAASVVVPPSPSPAMVLAPVAPRIAGPPAVRGAVRVNTSTFPQQVLDSEVPVLVDFYASWCGPCKAMSPVLDEVAAESPQARVVKVDIDESPELAARYHISSVPCLMMFQGGQATARHQGLASKARVKALLGL